MARKPLTMRIPIQYHVVHITAIKQFTNYSVSQKTSHIWLAITLTHMNGFWYFFGRSVTDKIGNQKTLYYATSSNLCFCTTWQNAETQTSHFHSVGLCYTHNAPVRCLPERNSCHLWCVWQRLIFVEIARYPINTVRWLSLQAWQRTTPIIYTATDTVADLVNTEHVRNRQQDGMLPSYRSCLVHPVDRFDGEGWFSSDQVIFLTMFCVCW